MSFFFCFCPILPTQCGTADAEIKLPSAGNKNLSRVGQNIASPTYYQECVPSPAYYQECVPLPAYYQECVPSPAYYQECVPSPAYYQECVPSSAYYQECVPFSILPRPYPFHCIFVSPNPLSTYSVSHADLRDKIGHHVRRQN